MRIVLVDCHDSFTWNLVQGFLAIGAHVDVVSCDHATPQTIRSHRPDRVVLGPGPGRPEDAGSLMSIVQDLIGRLPLLGVCLGHQAIGLALGSRLRLHAPVHGHALPVLHDGAGLFTGLAPGVCMTRYHSLVIDPDSVTDHIEVSAWSPDGAIMGIRHRHLPVYGVQFHPESVLSGDAGISMLRRFIEPRTMPLIGSDKPLARFG